MIMVEKQPSMTECDQKYLIQKQMICVMDFTGGNKWEK